MQTRADSPSTLFAIGNPTSKGQKSLTFARNEVEAIVSVFEDNMGRVLFEQNATRMALLESLRDCTYLHFACHGFFNVEQPLDSALYLAGHDSLTLRDLLNRDLDISTVRLVVLSACQTGITDFQNVPDEAIGLPAGFLQAGVPGVISTLWRVDDLSTALLMQRFYELHLREKLPPALALRRAQLWLRELTLGEVINYLKQQIDRVGESDWNLVAAMEGQQRRLEEENNNDDNARPFVHPYFWAAFTFTGI